MAKDDAKDLEHAKKRLDDEFGQIRRRLDDLHEAMDRVVSAQPEDDIEALLKDLEDEVHKVRTGGWLRPGANGHARARKDYLELRDSGGGG